MLIKIKLNNAKKLKLFIKINTNKMQNSLSNENNIVLIVAKYTKHVFIIKQPTKKVSTTKSILWILNIKKWLNSTFINKILDKGIIKYNV